MRYFLLLFSLFSLTSAYAQEKEIKNDTTKVIDLSVKKNKKGQKNGGTPAAELKDKKRSNKTNRSSISPDVAKKSSMAAQVSQFNRYQTLSKSQLKQRSPSDIQQLKMNEAVTYLGVNSPNSFEYHFAKYISGNYNIALGDHLLRAEKLNPSNTEVHIQLAAFYMISESTKKANVYLKKLIEKDRLKKDVLLYSKDVLSSTPVNGTLITHGFEDTYGAWYVQLNDNHRNDVTIVSLDLLQSESYRKSLAQKGYAIPSSNTVDVNFLSTFIGMNRGKSISIALTTPKEYLEPLLNSVFITGLVFEHRTESFNNFWRNQELWERKLQKTLINSANDQSGEVLISNYLPMLLQMRKVYSQLGQEGKIKELDVTIDKIAVKCDKLELVQKLKNAY